MTQDQAPQKPFDIIEASAAHIDLIVPLFEGYRQFYHQPPALQQAREFLTQRLTRRESVIFLALMQDETRRAVGFTQLFPSFSSTAMKRVWILNDLFVAPEARRLGVGKALVEQARLYAVQTQARRLSLRTEITNAPAQALYESLGWKRDEQFFTYDLQV
jgi:GNAT superfamily N-acetyltransferase